MMPLAERLLFVPPADVSGLRWLGLPLPDLYHPSLSIFALYPRICWKARARHRGGCGSRLFN